MELTWISIAASLAMGLGAALMFVFAVKRGWFRDLEDAKYQVFWQDLDPEKGGRGGRALPGERAVPLAHAISKEGMDAHQPEKK